MKNFYLQTEPKIFCILILIFLSVFRVKYFQHQSKESKFLYLFSFAEIVILTLTEFVKNPLIHTLCYGICGICSFFAMYFVCAYPYKNVWKKSVNFKKAISIFVGVVFGVLTYDIPHTAGFVLIVSIIILLILELYDKIRIDNLTKLYNRYGMDVELQEQLKEYEKEHSDSFYIISCDLDNFKHINDTWGHLEGDRALVLIADVLAKVGKKFSAGVFRIGGDEFIIIADTQREGIDTEITNAVKSELDKIDFRDDFDIQMSIGVALYDGKSTIDELLNHADKKMYEAKRSSR